MTKLKVAIVTGGGSGLGFAIARKLTENNIHTILVGRNKTKLDTAVKSLGCKCRSNLF
jgi:NADP-dependent 3-hydroxy acid dehydrogenase YdfG